MRTRGKTEYGDFQTPPALAREACALIRDLEVNPAFVLEPTCGSGSFLRAAVETFPGLTGGLGVDVKADRVAEARGALKGNSVLRVERGDFFEVDWDAALSAVPEPILVLGNPPWVTNSALGRIDGVNLPVKANVGRDRGIDALTGKSNFDISQWMLERCMDLLTGRSGAIAMLVKTAVARKALKRAWTGGQEIASAHLFRIDARRHFAAGVDACLFVVVYEPGSGSRECAEHPELALGPAVSRFGLRGGRLLADIGLYEKHEGLLSDGGTAWRSGVKHDCAKVFVLERVGGELRNGLGELVDVEEDHVFPLLKSSDVARGREAKPSRSLLVTQRRVGEDTSQLAEAAPRTWKYLVDHGALIDRRKSRIYERAPRFSMFGVGPYTFSRHKIAISGLYKSLEFRRVGPHGGKPVLFDDTCYFLPCESAAEASRLHRALRSKAAAEFFSAYVFWDAKRPITAEILRRLDLAKLVERRPA